MSTDNPKGYANPDLLWSAAQLKERMDDPNLRIIDTRAPAKDTRWATFPARGISTSTA